MPSLKKTTQLSWWHTETVISVYYIPPVELQQWPPICLSKLANLLFAAWLTFGVWMWPLTFRADKWLTPTCGEQAQGACVCEEILLAMWQFSYCVWPQRLRSFDLAFWHDPRKHTHCCISMHTQIFCHLNDSKFDVIWHTVLWRWHILYMLCWLHVLYLYMGLIAFLHTVNTGHEMSR